MVKRKQVKNIRNRNKDNKATAALDITSLQHYNCQAGDECAAGAASWPAQVWVLTEGSCGRPPVSTRVLPHQDSGATAGLFSLRLLSINQKITLSVPLSTA